MSAMITSRSANSYQRLTENVSRLSPLTREQLTGTAHGVGWKGLDPETGALTLMQMRISKESLIRAFNENYIELATIFALSLLLILLLKRPQPGVAAPGAH